MWYSGRTFSWCEIELGLNFVLPFLVGVWSWENYLSLVCSFIKWGHGLPLSVARRIRNDQYKLPDIREMPFKGFLNSPTHAVPSTQWAFRKYLMTEESLAPFIWGHESLAYRNHTPFNWATALIWGSPQSPGWHISPANQVFIVLCVDSEHEKDYLGIPFLKRLETPTLGHKKQLQ